MLKILSIMPLFIVFKLIISQNIIPTTLSCSNTSPKSANDCFNNLTNDDNICCYLSGVQTYANEKMCISIPSTSYVGDLSYILSKKTYNIQCRVSTSTPTFLKQCGFAGALSSSDCSTGSTFVNSCCYYSGTDVNKTPQGCYWLGTKYSGKTNWAGLSLECASNNIMISLVLIFFYFCVFFS